MNRMKSAKTALLSDDNAEEIIDEEPMLANAQTAPIIEPNTPTASQQSIGFHDQATCVLSGSR